MRFEARVFRLAKDPEHPEQNQDALRVDPARGTAALADGVTSGIFSGPWAEILTEAVQADPPDLDTPGAFAAWLARARGTWSAAIDTSRLAWFQKAKMQQGAFSTLLWFALEPCDPSEGTFGTYRLRAWAIGDSCLFHVRDGTLLAKFPIQSADELQADPLVVGSLDLRRDGMLEFETFEATCRSGDLLVLATDAVAEWALRAADEGEPPAWEQYWATTENAWRAEVASLRQAGAMRYDDATLALVRVVPPGHQSPEPSDAPGMRETSGAAGEDDDLEQLRAWARRVGESSEQMAQQVTEQLRDGLRRLRDAARNRFGTRKPPQE